MTGADEWARLQSRSPSPCVVEEEEEEVRCCPCRWSTKLALATFMGINFVTYYDRGAIAGGLSDIKRDPHIGDLSDQEAAMLVSMFMVGYMVFSPIFASLGGTIKPTRIIAFGLWVWVAAALLSAFSWSYASLVLARCMVGIGEAAYAGFIPPMIDDMAPAEKRTIYIALYFAMIPFGQAVGMGAGGVIAGTKGAWGLAGWQFTFLTEVIPMLPLIAIVSLCATDSRPSREAGTTCEGQPLAKRQTVPPPDDCSQVPPSEALGGPAEPAYPTVCEAVGSLLCNPMWVLTVLGYAVYTFVIGGIAAWGIDYLEEGPLRLDSSEASVLFGACTAVTGITGTFLGGAFVDRVGGSKSASGVYNCQKFNTVMILIAVPAGVTAFMSRSRAFFFLFCFLSELALFATTAPANCALLESVTPQMRTYAMAFCNFCIHAVGDFPSPIAIGVLSDAFSEGCPEYRESKGGTQEICVDHNCTWIAGHDGEEAGCVHDTQLRNALVILFCFLVMAAVLWAWAAVIARRRAKTGARRTDVRIN